MGEILQGYQSYKKIQSVLQEDMIRLESCCQLLDLAQTQNDIRAVREKSASDCFNVAVIGEFKRGKSTLINGLLGKRILPADPLPCSATLNRVTYDAIPHASILFKDGTTAEIEVEELEQYVTKLTEEAEEKAATIREATVYYPLVYCKNNVDIIDTPGLNDDETMTAVTLSVIPEVDLSIMTIMALSPFSQYEKDFLENKLLTSDIGKIVFAVTRMDMVDEDDRDRVLEHIRGTIKKLILVKAGKVFGEGSKKYREYESKLGNIKVIGISPLKAVKGKEKGDQTMIEESNYPQFEKALEKMLVEDRGLIQLSVQVNKILSASAEIAKVLSLQENCSHMSNEEFEQKYEAALKDFNEIRAGRKEEERILNLSASELKTRIAPMVESYWDETLQELMDIIDQAEISEEALQKDKIEETQRAIIRQIENHMNNSQILLCEKVQQLIQDALGENMERLEKYEEQFFSSVNATHAMMTADNMTNMSGDMLAGVGGVLASAVLTNTIFGAAAGSVYQGYKQAGLKGALIGGGASLGTAYAANLMLNMFILSTGMMALALPGMIAVGILGALGGRFAVSKFLGSENMMDKFRTSLKDSVSESFREQRSKSKLVVKFEEQVDEIYNNLKAQMRNETEQILTNSENTLNSIREKKMEAQLHDEQEMKKMAEIGEIVGTISQKAIELNGQIVEMTRRVEA